MGRGLAAAPIAAALFLACAPPPVHYAFNPTGTPQNAKPVGCDFAVAGTLPDVSKYAEIGVLDLDGGVATSLPAFKAAVASQVCAAGGDLLVGQVGGTGVYVRGIVFTKVATSTPTSTQ